MLVSEHGQGVFSRPKASIPALGPRPLSQWLLDALSMGVKRLGLEANRSSPSNAEVMNA